MPDTALAARHRPHGIVVRLWRGVLVAVAAVGALAAHADTLLADVPMPVIARHPSVTVYVDGKALEMMLDTGADQNVLSARAVARLGLQPSAETFSGVGAAAPTAPATRVNLPSMRVGEARRDGQVAYVLPLPEEFGYDGILGLPFFNGFVMSLDYAQQTLRIYARDDFTPPTGLPPVAARAIAGKFAVLASAAGVTGWYVVDTGAGNALTLHTPTVERHRLRTTPLPIRRTVTGIGVGGVTRGDLVRLPDLALGPFMFAGVVAELSLATRGAFTDPRFQGNFGGELWRRFTVTLDALNGKIWLAPNRAYDDAFPAPRAGLVPVYADGQPRVADVMPDSPAAEAGVQTGDTIVTVDDMPVERLAPTSVSAALQQRPGTVVRLGLVDTAGHRREVTLRLRELL